jgi:hypothetical protein
MDNEQYIYIHVVSCVHGSVDLSICCPNKKEPGFQDMVSDPELSSFVFKNTSCTTSLEQEAYFMSRISICFSKLNYLALKIMTSSCKSFQDIQYYTFHVDMVPKSWQTQNSSMEFLVLESIWDWSWTVYIFFKKNLKLN